MITKAESDYLNKIPEAKKAKLAPYDPAVRVVAEKIKVKAQRATGLEVLFMGASALGIFGQNDIDLYVLCEPTLFEEMKSKMILAFGQPVSTSPGSIKWAFIQAGFDVELYLTNPHSAPMRRQIKVFSIIKNAPSLQKEYESIKLGSVGVTFREYQRRKYEFYNKILATTDSVTSK